MIQHPFSARFADPLTEEYAAAEKCDRATAEAWDADDQAEKCDAAAAEYLAAGDERTAKEWTRRADGYRRRAAAARAEYAKHAEAAAPALDKEIAHLQRITAMYRTIEDECRKSCKEITDEAEAKEAAKAKRKTKAEEKTRAGSLFS